ncbi:MAG: hypothetical protein ACREGJ_03030 [Candidatus Saccharimonadales bacterium]
MQTNPTLDRPSDSPELQYRIPGAENLAFGHASAEELARRAQSEAMQQLPTQETDRLSRQATEHASEYVNTPKYLPEECPRRSRHISHLLEGYRGALTNMIQQGEAVQPSIWRSIKSLITGEESQGIPTKKYTRRDLIRAESRIGSQLFGAVPKGHQREFFCLDEHAWIWYEQWKDAAGKKQQVTTRYEIHDNGILKVQDDAPYRVVEGEELQNFMHSMDLYYDHVARHIYRRDPRTGHFLPHA